MDWLKKKKSLTIVQKQRLVRGRERGAMLLEDLIECCDGKSNPIKFFSADQIVKAIDNGCKCNIPQRSGNICKCTRVSKLSYYVYGDWYSGTLDNHRRILLVPTLGAAAFDRMGRDIAISSMVSGHKNFMKLVGCCLETKTPYMVYYGDKKQYSHLDLSMVVSWRKRMKIAEDIATALAYLHTAFSRPFVYANMSLWNILLDEDGVAKLSEFSNCVPIPYGETYVKLDHVRGAYDYIDDDYITNGVVSEKTDAFGFGIFMQKLLTGEEIFDQLYDHDRWGWKNKAKRKFPGWLSKSFGVGRMNEIVDPRMGEVAEEELCQMEAFLILSERCMCLGEEVPKMGLVAKELKRLLNDFSSFSSSSGETQL